MLLAVLVCAALTLVATLLIRSHGIKGRRLARLWRAQQQWALEMDRRAEPSQSTSLPFSARKAS